MIPVLPELLNFFFYVQSYQILNSDDHANFLRKNGRRPTDYRPDIIHQVSEILANENDILLEQFILSG